VPPDLRDQIVDFVRCWTVHRVARHRGQQVLLVAGALWPRERAQRLGAPGFLASGLRETGDHQLPLEESSGGLPAADVHDAGRRHCGGQPTERVAGVEPGGSAAKVERGTVEERNGLPAAARAAPALAYRCFLHQHRRHVLLLVQCAGRLQSVHRARPQVGASTSATSTPPTEGGLTTSVTMAVPGETEAGSALGSNAAERQPGGLIETMRRGVETLLRVPS